MLIRNTRIFCSSLSSIRKSMHNSSSNKSDFIAVEPYSLPRGLLKVRISHFKLVAALKSTNKMLQFYNKNRMPDFLMP